MARIAEREQDYREAVSCWRQSLLILEKAGEDSPGISKHAGLAAYNLAMNQLRLQQVDRAEKYFKRAYQDNPELTKAWYHLGSILKNRGRLGQSRVFFEKFLTGTDLKDVMYAKTLFHLGDIALRQKRPVQAEKLLKACLAKLPRHKMAARLLGKTTTG